MISATHFCAPSWAGRRAGGLPPPGWPLARPVSSMTSATEHAQVQPLARGRRPDRPPSRLPEHFHSTSSSCQPPAQPHQVPWPGLVATLPLLKAVGGQAGGHTGHRAGIAATPGLFVFRAWANWRKEAPAGHTFSELLDTVLRASDPRPATPSGPEQVL